ncbi:DNA repair protein RecO [bacterium]|nr:DNA repair protein RecO [candidate division CSSED10-310 bacterium]
MEINGLLLRKYPLGEIDRIFVLYTLEKGRIRAVGSGAQKMKSRWTGVVEPFQLIRADIQTRKDPSLFRIDGAECNRRFQKIVADLERLDAAYGVLEILDRFTPEGDANPQLYRLIVDVLDRIDTGLFDSRFWLRVFQLRFFALAGYEPTLDRCIRCGKRRGTRSAYFTVPEGGVVCKSCCGAESERILLSGPTIELIRKILGEETFPDLRDLPIRKFIEETGPMVSTGFEYYFEGSLRSGGILREMRPD